MIDKLCGGPYYAGRVRRLVIALATGFYAGYVPLAPGTCGSLLALPGLVLLGQLAQRSGAWAALVIGFSCVAAMWLAHWAERLLGEHDSSKIIVDEIVGMLVAGLLLPVSWKSVALCFLLFRFFDIVKPPPVGWLEKTAPGGIGVVADDVVAGIYANLVARLLLR